MEMRNTDPKEKLELDEEYTEVEDERFSQDYEDDDDFDDDDDDDDFDDDDDDDGVSAKLKKLKSKMDGVALWCLLIGFVGLLSLIWGIVISVKGSNYDPEDYFGDYYGSDEGVYFTYHIAEDATESYFELSCGTDIVASQREYFVKREYLTADKASKHADLNTGANGEFEGCDVLLLYIDDSNAHILWIKNNNPYEFVLNSKNAKLTTEEFDFAKEMNDPKDYYATYKYAENTYVTFNSNGKATFVNGGVSTEYKYVFVNSDWAKTWVKFNGGSALILYNTTTGDVYTFAYKSNQMLDMNGYKFYFVPGSGTDIGGSGSDIGGSGSDIGGSGSDIGGSGSDIGGSGSDIGGSGSDIGGSGSDIGGSGSDIGGSSSDIGGSGSDIGGSEATPDWSKLFDFSNVTIVREAGGYGYASEITTIWLDVDNGEMKMEIAYEEYGYSYTSTLYTDASGSYMFENGEYCETISDDEARYYYESFISELLEIDTDMLHKQSNNVYTDGDAVITLGTSGNIASIELLYYDFTFYNWGTTVVVAP